jgi:hypothetical protein
VPFPEPRAGLVIRYSYLWSSEADGGREEGVKDRPCAIILLTRTIENRLQVYVLPITHSPPANPSLALEIPQITKQRLGLDSDRSWVVLSEANNFSWPGPDLRPAINGNLESIVYGMLPQNFTAQLRDRFVAVLESRRAFVVTRTE